MPIRYDPIGRCIYCGAKTALSTEHIIPECINGQHELPLASCDRCAVIINKYEGRFGRTIFGDFRIKHNLRSKRPKHRRPTTVDIRLVRGNTSISTEVINISRDEFPAPTLLYTFGPANYFKGLQAGTNIVDFKPLMLANDEEMKNFHAKYGDTLHRFTASPTELARVVAKIAHGFCVAELGVTRFDHCVQNLDTILCRTNDIAFTVGGTINYYHP